MGINVIRNIIPIAAITAEYRISTVRSLPIFEVKRFNDGRDYIYHVTSNENDKFMLLIYGNLK